MGFFDKLSKTASDVGQKSKDVANIAKLKHQIAEEEKEILKIYEEIGRKYYVLRAQADEKEFRDDIAKLEAKNLKMQDLKKEINTLQGITICPKCGEEILLENAFCPKCGYQLLKPDSKEEMTYEQETDNRKSC